jgi:hypothetical protein
MDPLSLHGIQYGYTKPLNLQVKASDMKKVLFFLLFLVKCLLYQLWPAGKDHMVSTWLLTDHCLHGKTWQKAAKGAAVRRKWRGVQH